MPSFFLRQISTGLQSTYTVYFAPVDRTVPVDRTCSGNIYAPSGTHHAAHDGVHCLHGDREGKLIAHAKEGAQRTHLCDERHCTCQVGSAGRRPAGGKLPGSYV